VPTQMVMLCLAHKVSKSRKNFGILYPSRNEWNTRKKISWDFRQFFHVSHLVFGRIENSKNCFRDLLTFNKDSSPQDLYTMTLFTTLYFILCLHENGKAFVSYLLRFVFHQKEFRLKVIGQLDFFQIKVYVKSNS